MTDVSTWLKLLTEGNLFWFTDPLSAMRFHGGQNTFSKGMSAMMSIHWACLMRKSLDNKLFLIEERDIRAAFLHWWKSFAAQMERLMSVKYDGEEIIALQETNIAMAKALNNEYKVTLPSSALKYIYSA